MRRQVFGFLFALLLSLVPVSEAQDDACPLIVEEALARADETCDIVGRNEACYGNTRVVAIDWDQIALADFNAPGTIADIAQVASLATFPLDIETGEWGVAFLSLQADLPDAAPGQNLTFVLFGDVELQSAVPPEGMAEAPLTCAASVNTGGTVNVRTGPSTNHAVAGVLDTAAEIAANGRNEDGSWLRMSFKGQTAWGYAPLFDLDCDIEMLDIVEVDAARAYAAPMQAFYFTSGIGEPACEEAPHDGILVQAPTGTVVHFMVNGVEIAMGSTAFFQATPQRMTISVLEGEVAATSAGVTVTATPGQQIEVDSDLSLVQPGISDTSAQSPPNEPIEFEIPIVEMLPVDLVPMPIGVDVVVPGVAGWVDAGVTLRAGQTFVVVASGAVNTWPPCDEECTPSPRIPDCNAFCTAVKTVPAGTWDIVSAVRPPDIAATYPMPGEMIFALIGQVGDGTPFYVGDGGTFTALTGGSLRLGINDATVEDNAGEFYAKVFFGE